MDASKNCKIESIICRPLLPRAGSPREINVPRAGSPRDIKVPKAGSPWDIKVLGWQTYRFRCLSP